MKDFIFKTHIEAALFCFLFIVFFPLLIVSAYIKDVTYSFIKIISESEK